MTKKQLWLSVLLLVLAGTVTLGVFLVISLTPKHVTITYDDIPGLNVKLIKLGSTEDLHDITDTKIVGEEVKASVKSGEDLVLQKGAYVISVDGTNVEKKVYPLEVTTDTTKKLDISYSQTYLSNLLKTEEPAILNVLRSSFPTFDTIYSVRSSKLYQKGEWYGARLRYIGSDQANRDELKAILKKTNGSWELVTKTPEIIVTYPKYPTVPRAVVDDINSEEPVKIVPADQQSE